MDLCVIAHRGEAQAFTKGLKAISSDFYLGESYGVLICGEGVFEASKAGQYMALEKFDRVLNFGIAGSLSEKLTLGEIKSIRTHYLYLDNRPEFKSYSRESIDQLDCITSFERVLSDDKARELAQFADIVDRESWLIAKISHDAKIPFQSFKLISDVAGNDTDCFDIKEKALEYSQSLFDFYLELSTENDSHHQTEARNLTELPGSFTQQKKLKKVLKALSYKLNKPIDEILSEYPLPKAKGHVNQYIEELNCVLNPFQEKLQNKISNLQAPFTKIGAQAIFDPKLEKKRFRIQMEINNQKNIDNLAELLRTIDFKDFESVWDGNV